MTSTPTLTMQDGGEMPMVGLGMWKIPKPKCANVVTQALRKGYRHLDCACDYGNEPEVGQGLATAIDQGICKREDVWITSKLWNTYHKAEHVRPALQRTLNDLQIESIDLYHIHFPISLEYVPIEHRYPPEWFFDPNADKPVMNRVPVPISETWAAMEELVDEGLIKRIGICNFGTSLITDLLSYCRIRPSVLQVELHPYLMQSKLVRFAQESNIAVTAFSPLGAKSYQSISMAGPDESVLENPLIVDIASKHQKTPPQIVLRWAIERSIAVIPKTEQEGHLAENLDLFDFELTSEQHAAIDQLDQHRRFNDPGVFCEAAFNTYNPIFD